MIEKLTERWVERMIEAGVVEKERSALYAFGLEQGLRTLVEIMLMLITSVVFGLFLQGVVMMIAFCSIRIYAGGYHARTPMQCAIKSWVMFTAFLLWLRYCPAYVPLQIAVLVVTGLCLIFLCPLPDKNKPLQDYEIPKYRKRSLYFYGIEVALYVAGHFIWKGNLSRSITTGMGMLLLVWGAYVIKRWWQTRRRHCTERKQEC